VILTSQNYGQFLVNSHTNFTGTYFADTVESLEHDSVYRFLKDNKITPAMLREKVMPGLVQSSNGFVVFDDTVIDKNHSRSIELVRKQYSGNAHRVIRGIGVVTCLYYNPDVEQFFVLDYRVASINADGKTKLDHVAEMFDGLIHKDIQFSTVLMDTWYAVAWLMRHIDGAQKRYYCPIRKNRKVDDSSGQLKLRPVSQLEWSEDELAHGKDVTVSKFAKDYKQKLFRVMVSPDRMDFVLTNDISQNSTDDVQRVHAIRWKVEEFHRELKQLTGIENCQARRQRSQRNHIAIAFMAWFYLKQAALHAGITIYEQKAKPLRNFVAAQWRSPATAFG
jgi:hypothetical protein